MNLVWCWTSENTRRVRAKASKRHQAYMLFPSEGVHHTPKRTGSLHLRMLNGKNSTSSNRLLQHHDSTRYFLLPPQSIASNHFDLLELGTEKGWNTRARDPSKKAVPARSLPGYGAAGTHTNLVYKLFHKKTYRTHTHTNQLKVEYLWNVAIWKHQPIFKQC